MLSGLVGCRFLGHSCRSGTLATRSAMWPDAAGGSFGCTSAVLNRAMGIKFERSLWLVKRTHEATRSIGLDRQPKFPVDRRSTQAAIETD